MGKTKGLKGRIIETVAKEWKSEVFPEAYRDACMHNSGDGLADFVRIELEEGVDWDLERKDLLFDNIRHVIQMAQTDLEGVIEVVEKLEKEELSVY